MKKLLFVEDFEAERVGQAQEDGYGIIALTPMACWELDKARMEYNIPEHYGTWTEEEDTPYLLWFMQEWLPKLADLTGREVELFHYLLTPLRFTMEAFLRRAYQMRWIFEKEHPEQVAYLLKESKGLDLIDDDIYRKGGSLFHSVCEEFFKTTTWWVPDAGTAKQPDWREQFRGVYDWIRTLSFIPSGWKSTHLCFATVIPDRIREARLRGYKVSFLPEFEGKEGPIIDVDVIPMILVVQEFTHLPFGVCLCLLPQLSRFFYSFLPKVLVLKEKYKIYLPSREFYAIIWNRRNRPHLYAAHMAARELGVKTVYVRHGWSADDAWENMHTRLESFDYYVAPTQVDYEFYRNMSDKFRLECKVV